MLLSRHIFYLLNLFLFNQLILCYDSLYKKKKKTKKEFVSLDDDQAEKLMLTWNEMLIKIFHIN